MLFTQFLKSKMESSHLISTSFMMCCSSDMAVNLLTYFCSSYGISYMMANFVNFVAIYVIAPHDTPLFTHSLLYQFHVT